ncbi:lactate utilization protein C [Zhihengliuella sp.]|uniref:LutC/YkgG family protein n=1 Tax=Zhihengliuella sp. TaxID=1954483 RepID=UPI002810EB9B|nr:lactate utilization protein C [Zhihengliuella sp.]
MSAREEILGRIHAALADAPVAPTVQRTYRREADLTGEELVEMLVDRLVDYKANVDVVVSADLPAALERRLAAAESYVVPPGLAESPWWGTPALAADPRRVVDAVPAPLSVTDLDTTSAVVTSSAVSVAESGTIILDGSAEMGRRAISLVPDHHVCVVPASTIVQLLPEALPRLDITRPQTWISGPSATSDIELERVEGVHGPRDLDVVIVTDL